MREKASTQCEVNTASAVLDNTCGAEVSETVYAGAGSKM